MREPLPTVRDSRTYAVRIHGSQSEVKAWVVFGFYPDGRVGELLIRISKEGTFIRGLADTTAIMASHALQGGVPMAEIADSMIDVKYEPFGLTDDPEVPVVASLTDYIGQRLRLLVAEQEGEQE